MMNKTKIEWCDSTWNPITGCLRGCEYCYARGIARRFEGIWDGDKNCTLVYSPRDAPKDVIGDEFGGFGLKYCVGNNNTGEPKLINAPYPYGFHPTLHRRRLEAGTRRWKKPRSIFVGSMTDVFGTWVPDRWIKEVFDACNKAPQHKYLFLTKNNARYDMIDWIISYMNLDNIWFGKTVTSQKDINALYAYPLLGRKLNKFLNIEPILTEINIPNRVMVSTDWIVIGAETGNRKGKIAPERSWIEHIVETCLSAGTPIFMKSSLSRIWRDPLIQEYPWEVNEK